MRFLKFTAVLVITVLLSGQLFLWKASAEESLNELLGEAAEQNRKVTALTKSGRYREALPYSKRSLEIWETILGEDHPNLVHRINSLAVIHETLGEYAESEKLFRRALSIREINLGNSHPSVAESLADLVRVCRAQGKYQEADILDQRAADIRKKTVRSRSGSNGKRLPLP